jgi:WD40 repeat protein/energy-coupling factor transporter ATP-binding protein EcfA2
VANATYDVFVSYSRADARHAMDIDSVLRSKGLRPFFDRRSLAPGLPWLKALEQAIGAAKAAIVLIGPRGLGNTQQYERDLALIRQTNDPAFPVVPVILPDTTSDPPFDFLRLLTWVDFSHVARVSDAPDVLQQLLAAVQGGGVLPEAAREAICPYRGLDAFREEDSAFFFGRGSADDPKSPIGELISKVREHPFVMVVGRSGSGKSSLVYAGLLPALRRERERFWNVLSLRPGPTPLRALAAAFNPRANNEGAAEYAQKITNEANRLRTGDPELLSHMVREELDQAEGKPDRLLLYIDQWEELYAQAHSSNDKARPAEHATDVNRFIDLLLTASRIAPVAVVGTVRADFYDPLIGHHEIKSLLPTRQVLLGKMLRSELEQAIVEPAKKVGLTFEPPSLVQRVLDEVGEDEGMLPLLQYALKETWARRKGNAMTADSYERSGGVQAAIRSTAERTFDALSAEDQQAARQLFLRLVTPGEGQEDTRARAAMPVDEAQRKIVEQFAAHRTRLLVTGFDRAARPTVEVAHEALIRTWPRFRQWIDSNREKLRSRAAILQAKAEWEQQGRREDLLLPAGFQLERARALLADPGDITTDDIKEFISLSSEAERKEREDALEHEQNRLAQIAAAQARTARLQRITRWAFAAAGAVMLIAGGIVGWLQWDKARQLTTKEGALTESRQQLEHARANVAVEQAANAELKDSLDKRQLALEHARANVLAELSRAQLVRADLDSALRLALQGTRVDLALPSGSVDSSPAAAALAAAVSRARLRFVLAHTDPVRSAAFSPDGSHIVTASGDKTAHIWDAVSGEHVSVLHGHESYVRSAAYSRDGSRIVTASWDGTARIWDAASGREIAILRHNTIGGYTTDYLHSAAFNPDGSRIVTASGDGTARIWDVAKAKEIAVLRGHGDTVSSAVFSPDGSRIVTASDDKTARIWDVAATKEIAVLRGHDSEVWSAVFGPDGSRVVTASMDGTARIWNTATEKEIAVLRGHSAPVTSAAFSRDGSVIVTASGDRTARIWDAATSEETAVLRGHSATVTSAAFSPDGLRIITASYDATLRNWDAVTGKEIAVVRGHADRLNSASFHPDGSRIVTASRDGTARIWDAASAKEIAVLRGHEGTVNSSTFSPDGSRIITASSDKTARIWDAASAREIAIIRGHDGEVRSAAFSPDGSRIVTTSWDGTARIWEAANAKQIAVLGGRDNSLNSASFSPDGSRIVTGSLSDTIRIWDAVTAREIGALRGKKLRFAAFSPDGLRLVTTSDDHTAGIWDAANGREIAVLRGHDALLLSAAFSPDGSRVITTSVDRTVRIWDAASAKEIATLRGHTGSTNFAVFSLDGSRVITASDDRTARIWDARLQTMPLKHLLAEACTRLPGLTKMTQDEMRLAGYPDSMPAIDVCKD